MSPSQAVVRSATLCFKAKIYKPRTLKVVDMDLAHAYDMLQVMELPEEDAITVGIRNSAINYVAQVGVGTPATNYTLLIDTGSANTWVGANKAYVESASSHNTGRRVRVNYGSGRFSGEEWTDTVTLSPALVVKQQSIGVAEQTSGLQHGDDGILGLGPVALTRGTVQGMRTVPTVLNNLVSQGMISEEVLGVYFIPASESSEGELAFGGYDDSVIVGSVDFVPLTTTYPASRWWGIDQSTKYGTEVIMDSTSGIVDTGSLLILITTYAFQKYQELTGGILDNDTGLLRITTEQYAKLQPLKFNIGDQSYELTPNAQIWPRSLNHEIGGTPDAIYLTVGNLPSTFKFSFIIGYTFLERYYTVYDTAKRQIGFATTKYTFSESN